MSYFHLLLISICIGLVALGCDTDRAVPIDEMEQPVAYVGSPIGLTPSVSRSDRELMVLDAASKQTWQLTSDWANDAQLVDLCVGLNGSLDANYIVADGVDVARHVALGGRDR